MPLVPMTEPPLVPDASPGAPPPGDPPPGGPPSRAPVGALARAYGAVPPPLLVLLAIVSIQVGAAYATQLFAALGPTGTVFLRLGLTALMLLAVSRPRLDRTLRENAGLILLFGATIALLNFSFYQAISRIPLGVAVTIEFLGPLSIAVATSRRLPQFLWIGLALVGVLLLAPKIGPELDPLGIGFAVLGGTCWASFILLSVKVGRAFARGGGLALGMSVGALLLLPFGLLALGTALAAPALLLGALAVALLSTAIPFSLEFEALRQIPPRTYGVLVTLEPAVAVLVGTVLLGETLGPRSLLAVACVTLAAIGITLLDRRKS